MPRLIEITAQVVSIKFQSKEHDWIKVAIRHDNELKVAVGTFDASELRLRHEYVLHGYWEHHETYGDQFKFTTMAPSSPVTYQGVLAYLQQAPQLGLARAQTLWGCYQINTVVKLRTDPAACAAATGVSLEVAMKWAAFFQERLGEERLDQELMGLLVGHGFQYKRLKEALLKKWGANAAAQIRRDPFHMLGMPSAGFSRTDAVYMALGKCPHKLKRQGLCAYHASMSDNSGHTWIDEYVGQSAVQQKISGTDVDPIKAIEFCVRTKLLERWEDTPGHFCVADKDRAHWERVLAESLKRLSRGRPKWREWMGYNQLDRLNEHQHPKVMAVLEDHPLFLLLGPPGTGKSFTLAEIVRGLVQEGIGSENICVVALAGKAAVRATELMRKAGVGIRARTIHSTMGFDTDEAGDYCFYHNRKRPMEFKVYIIDEISMLDTTLLGKFLDAVPDGGHVIMVGDAEQLEPVGSGAPLRDMLTAGVPRAYLTEIQRFSGTIERCCHSMVNDQGLVLDQVIDLDALPPQNMKLIPADASAMAATIRGIYEKIIALKAHNPVWDVQLMVAVNDTSAVSRKAMNSMLQQLLNPRGDRVDGNPFRVGDKVMMLKNSMLADSEDAEDKHYVANGEMGEVLEVELRKSVVNFGGYECVVPHGKLATGGANDDDAPDRPSIDLAYAATVHKMQGSQTPIAIVVLDEYGGASGPRGVCGKAWLYTAISRAQELCFLVGQHSTARKIMCRSGLQARRTRLVEYLGDPGGTDVGSTHCAQGER